MPQRPSRLRDCRWWRWSFSRAYIFLIFKNINLSWILVWFQVGCWPLDQVNKLKGSQGAGSTHTRLKGLGSCKQALGNPWDTKALENGGPREHRHWEAQILGKQVWPQIYNCKQYYLMVILIMEKICKATSLLLKALNSANRLNTYTYIEIKIVVNSSNRLNT